MGSFPLALEPICTTFLVVMSCPHCLKFKRDQGDHGRCIILEKTLEAQICLKFKFSIINGKVVISIIGDVATIGIERGVAHQPRSADTKISRGYPCRQITDDQRLLGMIRVTTVLTNQGVAPTVSRSQGFCESL